MSDAVRTPRSRHEGRWLRGAASLWGIVAASLTLGRHAHAADGRTPPVAVVRIVSENEVDPALVAVLTELVARGSATLAVGDAPGPTSVRVTLETRSDAFVLSARLEHGSSEAVLKEVPLAMLAGASPAVVRETLALAIWGLVEPLLARHGEPREEKAAPSPDAAPAITARRDEPTAAGPPNARTPTTAPVSTEGRGAHRVARGVHAGPQSYEFALDWRLGPRSIGAGAVGFSFGGGASILLPSQPSTAFGVDASYVFPVHVSAQGVDARVTSVPLRMRGSFEPVRWSWGRVDVGVATGVDVLTVDPTSALTPLRVELSSTRLQPVVGTTLGVRSRVGAIDFFVAAGLDFDLASRRWAVLLGDHLVTFFEPSWVRPQLTFGLDGILAHFELGRSS